MRDTIKFNSAMLAALMVILREERLLSITSIEAFFRSSQSRWSLTPSCSTVAVKSPDRALRFHRFLEFCRKFEKLPDLDSNQD